MERKYEGWKAMRNEGRKEGRKEGRMAERRMEGNMEGREKRMKEGWMEKKVRQS